jgi:trehalose 6-phosphate phosphatase
MSETELRTAVRDMLTDSEEFALCLDFDGTLAPIVEDPNEAALPAATRTQVSSLAANPAVDVAVISGRALEDIRSRVGIDGIGYAGNHGLEIQQGEEMWVHPDVKSHRGAMERTLDRIEQELEAIPGAFVEDKHATAAVHYRRAGTDDSSLVIARVQGIVESEDGLSMEVDNQTVEIRPEIDQRKGEAVMELIDTESGTGIVYLGDAETDVDAFETLAALENDTIQISVGNELPSSGYHLDSPADVEAFLAWLGEELAAEK